MQNHLKKAFLAGFIACSELPEEIEIVDGSIEKTMDQLFEKWMAQHTKQYQ